MNPNTHHRATPRPTPPDQESDYGYVVVLVVAIGAALAIAGLAAAKVFGQEAVTVTASPASIDQKIKEYGEMLTAAVVALTVVLTGFGLALQRLISAGKSLIEQKNALKAMAASVAPVLDALPAAKAKETKNMMKAIVEDLGGIKAAEAVHAVVEEVKAERAAGVSSGVIQRPKLPCVLLFLVIFAGGCATVQKEHLQADKDFHDAVAAWLPSVDRDTMLTDAQKKSAHDTIAVDALRLAKASEAAK